MTKSEKKTPEQILKQVDCLFNNTERTNVESTWGELSQYVLPIQSGRFNGRTSKGSKKMQDIYDSTAINSNQSLASTIHSIMTNDAVKWSKLRFGHASAELNNNKDASDWLQDVVIIFHEYLSNSNFITEINKAYKSYTGLGNMCLFCDERESNSLKFSGFQFRALHLSQVAWSEGAGGLVNVFYRKFKLTARQAIELYGDEVGESITKAYEKNPEEEFDFVLAIYPRDKLYTKQGLAKADERPYVECVIQVKDKKFVKEGGYYEFPVFCVRWETLPEEVYGQGPGHLALPDIKTLNKVKQLYLESLALAVRPPLKLTGRNDAGDINFKPGGLSVMRPGSDVSPMVQGADFKTAQFSMEDLQAEIKAAFFLDKLIFPPRNTTGEMTATEVLERVNQMQKILGPIFGRLNSELLNPLVSRCFNMLLRGGALPPLPPVLQEGVSNLTIEYVNPLARSQRIEEVQAMQQWIGGLMGLAQSGKPEVLDLIDGDEVAKLSAKIYGVPEDAVQSDKEVAQIRQQRAQQQQQMMQLESGVKAADIAAKMSKSNRGGDGQA